MKYWWWNFRHPQRRSFDEWVVPIHMAWEWDKHRLLGGAKHSTRAVSHWLVTPDPAEEAGEQAEQMHVRGAHGRPLLVVSIVSIKQGFS